PGSGPPVRGRAGHRRDAAVVGERQWSFARGRSRLALLPRRDRAARVAGPARGDPGTQRPWRVADAPTADGARSISNASRSHLSPPAPSSFWRRCSAVFSALFFAPRPNRARLTLAYIFIASSKPICMLHAVLIVRLDRRKGAILLSSYRNVRRLLKEAARADVIVGRGAGGLQSVGRCAATCQTAVGRGGRRPDP